MTFTETLWFWHHLDRNQQQIDAFEILVYVVCFLGSCEQIILTCFWSFAHFQGAVLLKTHFVYGGFSSGSVLLHHSHWVWHHFDVFFTLGVSDHLFCLNMFLSEYKQSEVMCFFLPPERSWCVFLLKNHVLYGCFCSDSVFLVSLWQKSAPRWCLSWHGASCHPYILSK